jgi:hypothetical protein
LSTAGGGVKAAEPRYMIAIRKWEATSKTVTPAK